METVLRGLTVYGFLLLVFRMSGKRTLAEITNFDFVLLLIIAETTQQALLGEDFSVTAALLLILTLVSAEIVLTLVKQRFPRLDHALEGKPVVLVEDGKLLHQAMHQERVDLDDVLEAARRWRGLERIDQIKLAILEKDGNISVIAAQADRAGRLD